MALSLGSIIGQRSMGAPSLGSPALTVGPMIGARFMGAPRLPATPGASDITAELVDAAVTTVVEPLLDSYGRSWVDTPSDAGNWSVTFGKEDPTLPDIEEGSLVRLSLKGYPAVTGVAEVVDGLLIAGGGQGEQQALETTWTGRLHGTLPERGLWYPARGIRTLPIQENRNCDYTDPGYDDSGWGSPQGLGAVSDVRIFYYYYAGVWSSFIRLFVTEPAGIGGAFPDPFAQALWAPGATLWRGRPLPADAGGDIWGRRTITIPATTTYHGFGFSFVHNSFDVFIDGVLWFSITGQSGDGTTGDGQIELSAGEHTLAFHAHSGPDFSTPLPFLPAGFNPGLFAWSIFRADAVSADGFIAHSDGTEKLVGYVPKPGMTAGRAWRMFSDEAEARGVQMPARSFTDTVDSAGRTWPVVSPATRVGTDGFTFLREMSASFIDWKMRATSYTLDMWVKGTTGSVRDIGLHGPNDFNPDGSPMQESSTLNRLEKKGQQS